MPRSGPRLAALAGLGRDPSVVRPRDPAQAAPRLARSRPLPNLGVRARLGARSGPGAPTLTRPGAERDPVTRSGRAEPTVSGAPRVVGARQGRCCTRSPWDWWRPSTLAGSRCSPPTSPSSSARSPPAVPSQHQGPDRRGERDRRVRGGLRSDRDPGQSRGRRRVGVGALGDDPGRRGPGCGRGGDLARTPARLARPIDVSGRGRGVLSMAGFGVTYAVASLTCALPLFLAAVIGSFGRLGFSRGRGHLRRLRPRHGPVPHGGGPRGGQLRGRRALRRLGPSQGWCHGWPARYWRWSGRISSFYWSSYLADPTATPPPIGLVEHLQTVLTGWLSGSPRLVGHGPGRRGRDGDRLVAPWPPGSAGAGRRPPSAGREAEAGSR